MKLVLWLWGCHTAHEQVGIAFLVNIYTSVLFKQTLIHGLPMVQTIWIEVFCQLLYLETCRAYMFLRLRASRSLKTLVNECTSFPLIHNSGIITGECMIRCSADCSAVHSIFLTQFLYQAMYPENPEGTQVIVGSMKMGHDIYPTLPRIKLTTCSVLSAHSWHKVFPLCGGQIFVWIFWRWTQITIILKNLFFSPQIINF